MVMVFGPAPAAAAAWRGVGIGEWGGSMRCGGSEKKREEESVCVCPLLCRRSFFAARWNRTTWRSGRAPADGLGPDLLCA
jgi:hypothetical protein